MRSTGFRNGMMDRLVARLNIEHLGRRLEEENDPRVKETLFRLLAEEREKLAKIERGQAGLR